MRRVQSWFIIVLLFFFVSVVLYSQDEVTIPYFMGFESSEVVEIGRWVVNPGDEAVRCKDQWMIGSDIYRDGNRAIYISSDSLHCSFDSIPCVQYLYRDFSLPRGTYELCFDYLYVGNENTFFGVGQCVPGAYTLEANSSNGVIPAAVQQYEGLKSNSGNWQNHSVTLSFGANSTIRVFFVWASKNARKVSNNISVCVDNVQIVYSSIAKPRNFKITSDNDCGTVLCSWDGLGDEMARYDLQYRKTSEQVWRTIYDIQSSDWERPDSVVVTLFNPEEGLYDFRVRTILNSDTSAWLYVNNQIIYCPQGHCVNYSDLHDSRVTCTYGKTSDVFSRPTFENAASLAYADTGVMDFGSDIRLSQHTTNWDRTKTDIRTGGRLKLVPDNAFVSVRLGNWDINNGAESVTYEYEITDETSILLLQYAVVMELPDHSDIEQPRFILEILRRDGTPTDRSCGYYNFAAKEDASWNTYEYISSGGRTTILWKDWTTVGLNLKDYIGETMMIRLTTYDCFQGGHFGYAYFTIDCASAQLQTSACALDLDPHYELIAPEGFNYSWYSVADGSRVLSNERTYTPPDTMMYRCVVSSKENNGCSFEISTQCKPKIPNPSFSFQYAPRDCRNVMEFTNNSYISYYQTGGDILATSEPCKYYQWVTWNEDSSWSSISEATNPTFYYPSDGGKYYVRLTASIDRELYGCQQSFDTFFTLPSIREYVDIPPLDTVICSGMSFWWEEKDTLINTDGSYKRSLKTFAGCDSIITYNVTVRPSVQKVLSDTAVICAYDNLCYNEGGCYGRHRSGMFVRELVSSYGCDSSVIQYVFVIDSIKPVISVSEIDMSAGRDFADIDISGSGFDYYTINGVRNGSIRGLGDGEYHLIFYKDTLNTLCTFDTTIVIVVQCLKLRLLEQIKCNDGVAGVVFPFVVDSGGFDQYSIIFGDEAKRVGFEDVIRENIGENTEISFVIPASAVPSVYDVKFVFFDKLCDSLVIDTTFMYAYPSSVLFVRWNDVISLKNARSANFPETDYVFSSYQWYLDGEKIDGAQNSYYWQEGGLKEGGEYQLHMIRKDGKLMETCPFVYRSEISRVSERDRASFVKNGSRELEVYADEGTLITLYNVMGRVVYSAINRSATHIIPKPQQSGLYILTVEDKDEIKHITTVVM